MPACTPTSSPIGVPTPLLAGPSESSDHRQTLLGNRQIGQPTTAPCAQNLLPIYHLNAAIYYRPSPAQQMQRRICQEAVLKSSDNRPTFRGNRPITALGYRPSTIGYIAPARRPDFPLSRSTVSPPLTHV